MKLLVGRDDHLAVRTLHRSAHRTCKIRNGTRPLALSNLHFIGMIDQMVVGERLEKFDGLRLVIISSSCRLGLTRPKYSSVPGMPLFKRLPVLCVPRIVECPHEFKIVLCHLILPKYTVAQARLNPCWSSTFRRSFYTLAHHSDQATKMLDSTSAIYKHCENFTFEAGASVSANRTPECGSAGRLPATSVTSFRKPRR